MIVRKIPWITLLVGLIVVVVLPVAGYWTRRRHEPGCALDGAKIDPIYRVKVVDSRGKPRLFCCLRCAEIWVRCQPTPPQSVAVTDEVSGQEIDAPSAW
jgi:hypothetical protein